MEKEMQFGYLREKMSCRGRMREFAYINAYI